MIFSELYSAYYNAVARILREACAHPVSRAEIRRIVGKEAFGESLLTIEPAMLEGRWQLLKEDGTSVLRYAPTLPLTLLERRWIKAISQDPRIRLFPEADLDDPDVEPLFRQEDIDVFDRYADGDPYGDPAYIRHFRTILDAIRERAPLEIEAISPLGSVNHHILVPTRLEYSEKDDKFRLEGMGYHHHFVNLARITECRRFTGETHETAGRRAETRQKTVVLEVTDERNALERVLMHFAHFEKQAEKLDGGHYRVQIVYAQEDETEMLIRILGFGAQVRVVFPEDVKQGIRERLEKQKKLQSDMFADFFP